MLHNAKKMHWSLVHCDLQITYMSRLYRWLIAYNEMCRVTGWASVEQVRGN